jgi:deoxycytidylate deaminase
MTLFLKNMLEDTIIEDSKVLKFIESAKPICLQIPRAKKHVSLIVRKGKVLATGTNNFKGHPAAASLGYRFSEMHSELNAFLKCSEKSRLTLINLRFNAQEEMRMSRPCALCLPWCAAIFEEIYYTCPDGHVRRLDKSSTMAHNSLVSIGYGRR